MSSQEKAFQIKYKAFFQIIRAKNGLSFPRKGKRYLVLNSYYKNLSHPHDNPPRYISLQ